VDAICRDHRAAAIPEKEKALFDYLAKLTAAPATCAKPDVDGLLAHGWTAAEVFDAVTVCSLFNYFNRWIDGMGVPDIPKGFYEARLEQFGDRGYAPS
jgi:alkylhydroperoxidase family enzyme